MMIAPGLSEPALIFWTTCRLSQYVLADRVRKIRVNTYLVQGEAGLHHEDEDRAHEKEEHVDPVCQIRDGYLIGGVHDRFLPARTRIVAVPSRRRSF